MIETIPEVPVETVTPIKPSEAIRLGILKYPVPACGDTIKGNSACAVGAMLAGFGWDDYGDASAWSDWRLDRVLPLRFADRCPEPACHWDFWDFWTSYALAHLNDTHRWSRERIADWLAEQGL